MQLEGRLQSTRIMAAQDRMSAHGTIELILGILPCPLFSKVRGQFYLGGILLPRFQCSKGLAASARASKTTWRTWKFLGQKFFSRLPKNKFFPVEFIFVLFC